MFGIGTQELLLILLVVLLLFGARRIPSALGGLGKGIREFKKGLKGDEDEAASPEIVAQLKTGLGKQIRLLPDGTLEVGVEQGATLVQVDQVWATIQDENSTGKIPLVSVKRIVFRA
ncbi:MAG: twin-arginine translocase TatA/TatE family subunit [Myxococcota bacterium]|jgi:sec-independent protein translocase protein TatA|nr:twin-arginine translocase TatA/TatE family subunit [Myxococcota bacterium]MBP8971227.1 twin-arginine translocase TatA/TatE family subunit [Myxococcota bacterium]OQC33829.1 MAG: twin arginine translocase protein A [Deltaproteobacteria bacterium ADurb.Bin058]HHW96476.1 twin-arginine translocase TatA/TatE family subunit [Oligoflexales bacterium]